MQVGFRSLFFFLGGGGGVQVGFWLAFACFFVPRQAFADGWNMDI